MPGRPMVGGLNGLLVGAFNFDLVATLFGEMSALVLVNSRRLVGSV